ncbi:MAG: hypothetical protein AAF527_01310 [Pseudomonadota bacterium]
MKRFGQTRFGALARRLAAPALAGALLSAALAAPVAAEEPMQLTAKQVAAFVETLDDLQRMNDRLAREGKLEFLQMDSRPEPGAPFTPFAASMPMLKDIGEYGALEKIVKAEGFKSVEAWAAVADPVMAAVVSLEIEREDPDAAAKIAQMKIPAELADDPSLPPAVREQLAASLEMSKAMALAPEQHKETVKPFMGDIRAWMEESEAREAGAP